MPQVSRRPQRTPAKPSRRKPEYIAAVRFHDGGTRLFSVSNAGDAAEARRMVIDEVGEVAAVVVALR